MRKLLFFMLIVSIIWACSSTKGIVKLEKELPTTETDSIEYDVETFDSRFDAWYAQHKSPTTDRSLEYYENWNHQYVNAWNEKAMQHGKNSFFEPIVGYNQNEEYGFDLNHKLFYYFQYVENVLKIQIMPGSPRAVPF